MRGHLKCFSPLVKGRVVWNASKDYEEIDDETFRSSCVSLRETERLA